MIIIVNEMPSMNGWEDKKEWPFTWKFWKLFWSYNDVEDYEFKILREIEENRRKHSLHVPPYNIQYKKHVI